MKEVKSVYCGEINVGQTIKSNIDFWKEKYFELEKNSIPISVIENEIEELSAMKLTDTIAKAEVNFAIVTLEDIIYEERRRNNTDV